MKMSFLILFWFKTGSFYASSFHLEHSNEKLSLFEIFKKKLLDEAPHEASWEASLLLLLLLIHYP